MPLRRASSAAAWVVVLTMVWSTAVGFWGSFFLSLPAVTHVHAERTPEQEEAEHRRLCHCLSCPGGKQCCCLPKGEASAALRLVLRASCDQGVPLAAPLPRGAALAPTACAFVPPVLQSVPVFYAAPCLLPFPSRALVPPYQPPQLSLS